MPPKPAPKKINVSLLPDADLRPWTKDDDFDEKVLQEAHSLDKAISITSPHKIAGTRGDSELDVKPDEWYEFQKIQTEKKTMMLSMKQLGSKTGSKMSTPKGSAPAVEISPFVSSKGSRQGSGPGTPMMSGPEDNEEEKQEVDDDDNDDARYIIKMRRKLKSQHDAHTHRSKPMKTIDYEGRRCPAVLNVSTKAYEELQGRYPTGAAPRK